MSAGVCGTMVNMVYKRVLSGWGPGGRSVRMANEQKIRCFKESEMSQFRMCVSVGWGGGLLRDLPKVLHWEDL